MHAIYTKTPILVRDFELKLEAVLSMGQIVNVFKGVLLLTFGVLNIIDMVQAVSLLRLGRESNPYAVFYPHLWFPFKFILTIGFPIGLYKLDAYLDRREDGDFSRFLESVVGLMYAAFLLADVFYLFVVLRNMSTLGSLF